MTDDEHIDRRAWERPAVWIGGALLAFVAMLVALNLVFSVPEPQAAPSIPVRRAPPDVAGQPAQDALTVLFGLKDGACMSEAIIDRIAPDLVAVDASISITPWMRGWIDGGHGPRVFYGTLEEAVRALGGIEIAIDASDIWFKTGPTTAESIWALRTPLGRTVWVGKDAVELVDCGAGS